MIVDSICPSCRIRCRCKALGARRVCALGALVCRCYFVLSCRQYLLHDVHCPDPADDIHVDWCCCWLVDDWLGGLHHWWAWRRTWLCSLCRLIEKHFQLSVWCVCECFLMHHHSCYYYVEKKIMIITSGLASYRITSLAAVKKVKDH